MAFATSEHNIEINKKKLVAKIHYAMEHAIDANFIAQIRFRTDIAEIDECRYSFNDNEHKHLIQIASTSNLKGTRKDYTKLFARFSEHLMLMFGRALI